MAVRFVFSFFICSSLRSAVSSSSSSLTFSVMSPFSTASLYASSGGGFAGASGTAPCRPEYLLCAGGGAGTPIGWPFTSGAERRIGSSAIGSGIFLSTSCLTKVRGDASASVCRNFMVPFFFLRFVCFCSVVSSSELTSLALLSSGVGDGVSRPPRGFHSGVEASHAGTPPFFRASPACVSKDGDELKSRSTSGSIVSRKRELPSC
mmetsp:Transcript_1142/g.4852  ORF Transcript_1142/g.4852 Transcript_1142/m.4852 type:complete len:206 (-) Transcript_1142:66-683(-)